MTKWDKDLMKAPDDEPFLLKVNQGLFSGSWQFYKALRIRDKFFNAETKEVIRDPHSWTSVEL